MNKNRMNIISFQNESNLYRVEPITSATACWSNVSDVSDMQKATSLPFSELKGKELFAKFVRVNDRSYWKLYIKGIERIDVVYVETASLNPVGMYRNN